MERAPRISHAIYVWAADMISAPRTGVVVSPLKRCCHNAFISPPPAGERVHGRHLMVRMDRDTAGPMWRMRGSIGVCVCASRKCVNVWSCVSVGAYFSHHVAVHHPGVI